MRIRLAFTDDDTVHDEMPTLIAAVDEYTEDAWIGIPDFYRDDLAKYRSVREVNVHLSDEVVRALFEIPDLGFVRVEPA